MDDMKRLQHQAEQGDVWAQFTLGELYRKGEGLAQDFAEALRWHLRAAEGLHRTSKHILGIMYRDGIGVSQDPTKAVEWFDKAATGGHRPAQHDLARMYEHGIGTPVNPPQAAWWYGHSLELDREPMFKYGLPDAKTCRLLKADDPILANAGDLFLLTGSVDADTCRTCLDNVGIIRNTQGWKSFSPEIFTSGLHPGCRCTCRPVHLPDRNLEEMQNTIRMQVDVQKFKRGIYWRPLLVLSLDSLRDMD
jgi:hypothetical protein